MTAESVLVQLFNCENASVVAEVNHWNRNRVIVFARLHLLTQIRIKSTMYYLWPAA